MGGEAGTLRWNFLASGVTRKDERAGEVGLVDEPVSASWSALRFNAEIRPEGPWRGSAWIAPARGRVAVPTPGDWRTAQAWLGGEGSYAGAGALFTGRLDVASIEQSQPQLGTFRYWYRNLRVVRHDPAGWYAGARAAVYNHRALLLPVAGVEGPVGGGWSGWAATEPGLALPSFRRTFVQDGDWNVPDLTLPAVRRDLDLRGGLRRGTTEDSVGVRAGIFRESGTRTWRREDGLFVESAERHAVGASVTVEGRATQGRLTAGGTLTLQRVAASGDRVPYLPDVRGRLELDYAYRGWRWELTALGVGGRRDETGAAFGSFIRWDVGVDYRLRGSGLPLEARWVDLSLTVRNLTGVEDRRWPGVPGTGLGVYGGVQAAYGN